MLKKNMFICSLFWDNHTQPQYVLRIHWTLVLENIMICCSLMKCLLLFYINNMTTCLFFPYFWNIKCNFNVFLEFIKILYCKYDGITDLIYVELYFYDTNIAKMYTVVIKWMTWYKRLCSEFVHAECTKNMISL